LTWASVAPASELAGERLERAHHSQGFRQAHGVQLRDDGAAVGQQLDQTFRGEYLEGLAQGSTGNTQLGG
jgi:hypothetical protein